MSNSDTSSYSFWPSYSEKRRMEAAALASRKRRAKRRAAIRLRRGKGY
jgi:hypothetical protein